MVTDDGFVNFSPALMQRFEEVAKELVAEFSPDDRRRLDDAIRDYYEVGAAYGTSDEGLGVVVRTERLEQAKARIEVIFTEVDEPQSRDA